MADQAAYLYRSSTHRKLKQSTMEILPNDIVSEILLRSEPESLLRFKAVSHTWKETITNPDFVKSHAKRHNSKKLMLVYPDCSTVSISFCDGKEATVKKINNKFSGLNLFHDLRIVDSCNGLFLGEIRIPPSSYQLCMWNPLTGEYKQVPIPNGISNENSSYGFGYARSDNTHKVLCISTRSEKNSRMHLYSTRTNSWEKLRYSSKPRCPMVLVKGRLHFIPSRKKEIILAFDMEDEEFKEIETPDNSNKYIYKELMEQNGKLCICSRAEAEERKLSLWMMNEYGVKESWTKMVTIDFDNRMYFRNQLVLAFPLHIFENGRILVDNRTYDRFYKLDKQWVACYDSDNHTARDLELDCMPGWRKVHAYVETLISPNAA